MAPASVVIVGTPVAVLEPKNRILNSVSETIHLDSEDLPILTLPYVGMLISIQQVRDKSDIQCSLRDLLQQSIYQRMNNGIRDHTSV